MNCPHATPLLFAERDRPLRSAELTALEQHVAACPACAQLRRQLAEAAEAWRETTAAAAMPDPDEEWQLVRLRMQAAEVAARRAPRSRWTAWAAWTGLPLAAAAAVAVLVWSPRFSPTDAHAETMPAANAEFVVAADNRASTVVYVDQESGWLIVWAAAPPHGRQS